MKNFINSKITIFLVSLSIISASSTQAIELEGGRTAFEKSPRLLNAVTTLNSIRTWGAKYYFTIELPENAGEAIAKVAIQQRKGSDEIDFYGEETFAFEGDRTDKGKDLPLSAANWDEETQTISLTFDTPIAPGTTFTVGLKPKRNPDVGGIYLFGVTAFPTGQKPEGLYLGVGRLSFYDGSTFNRFFP